MASGELEAQSGHSVAINSGLQARLDLLASAGEVTACARTLTEELMRAISGEFHVDLDENNGAQLVTHMAMALTRLDRGTPEESAIAVVDDEIRERTHELDFSARILRRCGEQLGREVPEAEIAYLALHLCALIG
jgi:transcriptional regulatory protein LevR